MTTVIADKEYWPKTGTVINKLPDDLADLWGNYEEQASIFVAEALISDPPFSHLDLATPLVETFLWSCGGDCLIVNEDICEMIERAATDYDFVRSSMQAEDLEERLVGLEKIEKSIQVAKNVINEQLSDWKKTKR